MIMKLISRGGTYVLEYIKVNIFYVNATQRIWNEIIFLAHELVSGSALSRTGSRAQAIIASVYVSMISTPHGNPFFVCEYHGTALSGTGWLSH